MKKTILLLGACLATLTFYGEKINFDVASYVAMSEKTDSRQMNIEDGVIGNTANGNWIIYSFTPAETGQIQGFASASTNNADISLCVMVSDDLDALKETAVTGIYTHAVTKNGWANYENLLFGPFDVMAGTTYYYKINFIRPNGGSSAWACNTRDLGVETYQGGDIQGIPDPEEPLSSIQSITTDTPDFTLESYFSTGGSISVKSGENYIESTKNDAFVIYDFTVDKDGAYEPTVTAGTTKDGSSLNVTIFDNADEAAAGYDENNTVELPNTGSWNPTEVLEFPSCDLEAGKIYYLRLTFFNTNNTWVGNINNVALAYKGGAGAETIEAIEAEATYFNLQGIQVNPANAAPGIYVKKQGGKATRVIF